MTEVLKDWDIPRTLRDAGITRAPTEHEYALADRYLAIYEGNVRKASAALREYLDRRP